MIYSRENTLPCKKLSIFSAYLILDSNLYPLKASVSGNQWRHAETN